MKVEVLVSVMNQELSALVHRMNLSTDAVIINQCDRYHAEEMEWRGHRVRFFSLAERGVGRSRNNAILKADSDICLFSDEDIVYEDGYGEQIAAEFARQPRADMILFNIEIEEPRRTYCITERKRVRWYNCGRYGAVSFAIRRKCLEESGVRFSLLFGGGARYGAGEDVTFIQDCIKAGLKVYKSPIIVSTMKQDSSTWFDGYHEKYYKDKGALLAANFPILSEIGVYVQALKKVEIRIIHLENI